MSSVHVRPYLADIYRWASSCPAVPLAGVWSWPAVPLAGLAPRIEPLVLMPYLSIVLRMRCGAMRMRCDAMRCGANTGALADAAHTSRLRPYRGAALPARYGCLHIPGVVRLERSRTDSYELDGVVT